jgi:hypothetical protein
MRSTVDDAAAIVARNLSIIQPECAVTARCTDSAASPRVWAPQLHRDGTGTISTDPPRRPSLAREGARASHVCVHAPPQECKQLPTVPFNAPE